jgi:hypothetical protein
MAGTAKEDGGESLKTSASRRQIPLHPLLLCAGFKECVADLAVRYETHLFPNLKTNKDGKRTAAHSKAFG